MIQPAKYPFVPPPRRPSPEVMQQAADAALRQIEQQYSELVKRKAAEAKQDDAPPE